MHYHDPSRLRITRARDRPCWRDSIFLLPRLEFEPGPPDSDYVILRLFDDERMNWFATPIHFHGVGPLLRHWASDPEDCWRILTGTDWPRRLPSATQGLSATLEPVPSSTTIRAEDLL